MSGLLYAIIPEAGTNLVLDPSAESGLASGGLTFDVESAATVTQDTTYARFGTHSYKIVLTSTNDGMRVTTKAAANAAHYYTFYVKGTITGTLQVSMDAGATYNAAAVIGGASGGWVRYGVAIPAAQASTSTSTRIRDTLNDGTIYIDGIMCQESAYATTFIGGWIEGCRWSGLSNRSSSTRDPQFRGGGKLVDIEATYNCKVRQTLGLGLAPVSNDMQSLAIQPGAQFNNTRINPRVVTFVIAPLTGGTSTLAALHSIRKSLVNLFRPSRYRNQQPITFAYFGANALIGVYFKARYDSGLEGGDAPANTEMLTVRFVCNDPFLYEDNQETAALGLVDTLASNNYVAARIDGTWQNLGTGFNSYVLGIIIDEERKRVYMVGGFTTANGVTVNRVCYWDGYLQTFVAMDAGVGDNAVFCAAIAANGDLWIGGSFTTVGSGAVATKGLARWNYATSTWTAFNEATTTFTTISAIGIAPDTGDVFIGGLFTNWSGNANQDNIFRYNPAAGTWNDLGTGANGQVNSIKAISSTRVYVGGDLTTLNAVTINHIGLWNGTTAIAMASGADSTIYAVAVAANGDVYVTGGFTATPAAYIAKWNGSAWTALTSGLNQTGYSLALSKKMLIVGGFFTTAGGLALADRVALWTGTAWLPLDIDLPGTPIVYAIALSDDDDIYLGYNTTGTATVANQVTDTTVSPASTAETYPILTLTGSTTANALYTLQWIENYSQRTRIYLNMIIQAGETVTFDFRTLRKSVRSTVRGDVIGDVDSPSEFTRFALLQGQNTINVYATGTTTGATAILNWQPVHSSADGVAA